MSTAPVPGQHVLHEGDHVWVEAVARREGPRWTLDILAARDVAGSLPLANLRSDAVVWHSADVPPQPPVLSLETLANTTRHSAAKIATAPAIVDTNAPPATPERHIPYTDDGVTYCGWSPGHGGIIDGCGKLWPCPTATAPATQDTRPAATAGGWMPAEYVPAGAFIPGPTWPTCGGPMPEPQFKRTAPATQDGDSNG